MKLSKKSGGGNSGRSNSSLPYAGRPGLQPPRLRVRPARPGSPSRVASGRGSVGVGLGLQSPDNCVCTIFNAELQGLMDQEIISMDKRIGLLAELSTYKDSLNQRICARSRKSDKIWEA
jgi:hypothetical protein